MIRNIFKRKVSSDLTRPETFDKEFYNQFWSDFRNHLIQHGSLVKPSEELYNFHGNNQEYTYSGLCFGEFDRLSGGLWLTGWTDIGNGQIAAKFCIEKNKKPLFNQLEKDRDSIHALFGSELIWNKPPTNSVGVYKFNLDFEDESTYQDLFEWLRESFEKLERVFMWKLALYFIQRNHS